MNKWRRRFERRVNSEPSCIEDVNKEYQKLAQDRVAEKERVLKQHSWLQGLEDSDSEADAAAATNANPRCGVTSYAGLEQRVLTNRVCALNTRANSHCIQRALRGP